VSNEANPTPDEAPILDHGHGDSKYLVRSAYTTSFAHMGEVYLYHDLYGYIIKMSPDILDFINLFRSPTKPDDVCRAYANAFGDQTPEAFVGVFLQFGCLVKPNHDQRQDLGDMMPVRGRWNVWRRDSGGGLTLYTAWGDAAPAKVTLSPREVAMWDRFDGERPLRIIAAEAGVSLTEAAGLVARLAHHTVQAVKLSALPLSAYRNRPGLKPPYLTSTMPYARFEPGETPLPVGMDGYFSPEGYYRSGIDDADAQFDHQETTLSHLLRYPHPALHGQTYGAALVGALLARGAVPEGQVKVLEIGGGLGFMARAVIEALQAAGRSVDYHILELAPTLARAQAERLAGLRFTHHTGDVVADPIPESGFDLVLSNEMIGDLMAVRLEKARFGLDAEEPDDAVFERALDEAGEAGALIRKYSVPIGDAPESFYLNIGAWRMIEKLFDVMRPGATAFITEFGEMGRFPLLSTHLDHPELSIHFGHATLVAREVGFETDFAFVIDFMNFRRDLEGLATTRSYFRALSNLCAEHGVALEKIGYTRETFGALVEGKLRLDDIGDIQFDRLEDRLMGLVPHEFKALVLKKPVALEA
jgi:hypothetical protein